MKKKFLWIAAIFAVLALLVTGCPTDGGDDDQNGEDDVKINLTEVFSDTTGTQDKATVIIGENTVTFSFTGKELWGELITPEDARWNASVYSGIKFEYKSTGQATIFAQDTDSIFIFATEGDGWAAINQADNWELLTLPFSILQRQSWFGTAGHTFNKSAIIKLCFQISSEDSSAKKFEIRNFDGYK